jgi:hypothetical protein
MKSVVGRSQVAALPSLIEYTLPIQNPTKTNGMRRNDKVLIIGGTMEGIQQYPLACNEC